jgi:hypothetical protein
VITAGGGEGEPAGPRPFAWATDNLPFSCRICLILYLSSTFSELALSGDLRSKLMNAPNKDGLKQLDNLLAAADQSWLFGAGISLGADIPLMNPLTDRIFAKAVEENDARAIEVLTAVKAVLPDGSHIEHILSHLCDHATIAERSKTRKSQIGNVTIELAEFRTLHAKFLKWIAETVCWGYRPKRGTEPEVIGTQKKPIVTVDAHTAFVSALFNRSQAGIAERRGAVNVQRMLKAQLFHSAGHGLFYASRMLLINNTLLDFFQMDCLE